MAGMFYSLQQTAQKLNVNEEQVSKLVEERKLREFRDGSNVLFKVSEVEALAAEMGPSETEQPVGQEEFSDDLLEPQADEMHEELNLESLESETEQGFENELNLEPVGEQPEEMQFESLDADQEQGEEKPLEPEPQEEQNQESSLQFQAQDDETGELNLADSSTEPGEISLPASKGGEQELSLDDSLALLGDVNELGQELPAGDSLGLIEGTGEKKAEKKTDKKEKSADDTELSFALEDSTEGGDDLTSGDTAVTKEGISVLDESDGDFKLAEDTAAETKAMQEAASLEKIEDDVNLDTFGSGSGLLDLSLQADDTSLGGILDEIYTPGDEGAVTPAAAASAADVAAEADSLISHEQLVTGPAIVQGYVEPEPDTSSNIFGGMLLIPLAVVVYTFLITVTGQFGILSFLVPSGMMVLYIMGGVAVIALAISAYGYMQGTPSKPKQPKQPKPKKEKAPKPVKEKKVKVKAPKPVKEKKKKGK